MNYSRAALLLLVAASHLALSEELVIGAAEMENIGIEFARPDVADNVVVVDARAHVTIPPSGEYIVSSALSGLVSRVHARAGESVAQGDVLVEMRSAGFLTLQQEFLDALHYGKLAAAQLERDDQLAEEGIIAERRVEETRANAAAAAGRLSEHRQLLKIVGMRDEDIIRLQNNWELQDTLMIRAPADGIVLALFAKAGESVNTVEALCRMADLSALWLDIHLPQEHAGRVLPGMRVAVDESLVDQPGRVVSVGQAVDPETQVVSVRAELDKPGHGLRPGQLVAVSLIDSDMKGNAVRSIPSASLARKGDGTFVFVRSARGVVPMPVEVVMSTGTRAIVRNLGDDEVVVTGVSALKARWLAAGRSDE